MNLQYLSYSTNIEQSSSEEFEEHIWLKGLYESNLMFFYNEYSNIVNHFKCFIFSSNSFHKYKIKINRLDFNSSEVIGLVQIPKRERSFIELETALLSESVLARDWLKTEEDKAWKDL